MTPIVVLIAGIVIVCIWVQCKNTAPGKTYIQTLSLRADEALAQELRSQNHTQAYIDQMAEIQRLKAEQGGNKAGFYVGIAAVIFMLFFCPPIRIFVMAFMLIMAVAGVFKSSKASAENARAIQEAEARLPKW